MYCTVLTMETITVVQQATSGWYLHVSQEYSTEKDCVPVISSPGLLVALHWVVTVGMWRQINIGLRNEKRFHAELLRDCAFPMQVINFI